jgi:hypothetical protein
MQRQTTTSTRVGTWADEEPDRCKPVTSHSQSIDLVMTKTGQTISEREPIELPPGVNLFLVNELVAWVSDTLHHFRLSRTTMYR